MLNGAGATQAGPEQARTASGMAASDVVGTGGHQFVAILLLMPSRLRFMETLVHLVQHV